MRKPRAFITGIAGFAGSYLAEELLSEGYEVYGAIYKNESTRSIAGIKKRIKLVPLDILNAAKCSEVLKEIKPHYVFHLAAIASVGRSMQKERATFRINLEGSINILDCARNLRSLRSLLVVGSADSYGQFRPQNKTLKEDQPFNPVSPYGISKTAMERLCQHYHRAYGLPVVIARAFNHSGPRQTDDFVVPSFARQIAAIEAGQQKPIVRVGDLSARRDLSDVRDIVRGYRLCAAKGKSGEAYHFSSGKAVTIRQVLETLIGLSSRKIRVQVDRKRLRKSDIPLLRGSNRKATQKLGFRTRYTLQETLRDTLNYWRSELGVPLRR